MRSYMQFSKPQGDLPVARNATKIPPFFFFFFSDSQAPILRCRNDCRGPGQAMARAIIRWSHQLHRTKTHRLLDGSLDMQILKEIK
jgi:hypothetical protein